MHATMTEYDRTEGKGDAGNNYLCKVHAVNIGYQYPHVTINNTLYHAPRNLHHLSMSTVIIRFGFLASKIVKIFFAGRCPAPRRGSAPDPAGAPAPDPGCASDV